MASPLRNARILLGITGGIAAYKSVELCRTFQKAGATVRVIMTDAATEFIAPLTFETLTGHPVYRRIFDPDHAWEIEHIAWAHWGDVLVVAPATANIIAKMACGIADDALSTTALAFRGDIVAAPAMNTGMWENPQTRLNVQTLADRGVCIIPPGSGELACGDEGAGRLADLTAIERAVVDSLERRMLCGELSGKNILITAGPTAEAIDPVRHLSNASSGRMGMALAAEAARRGAHVTLVLGPTGVEPPEGMRAIIRVRSALQMRDAVLGEMDGQDILVFSAAVADYMPAEASDTKLKKEADGSETLTLKLVRTPDIASEAKARRKPGQIFVGFAAETNDMEANALGKMRRKGFDFIVGNEVSAENPAFAAQENAVTMFAKTG